ncbi:MarR family protein [Tepidimonas sediminis]|uniref:MarR family protein n=1 Tax=Tepidimonas sediminis TaxID=2588941 RepID=A0A554WF83_9BURK|nr:MarR family transcriptional regulator [Tepidimonas sediminis]TSE22241.1 MarR family protein [Tepidimonas sediminis]
MLPTLPYGPDERWRVTHLGRLLGHARRRFDARVLALMAHSPQAPLALSNLAARAQISAAIVHITRHLPLAGARLGELAASAGMTKQAMGDLVDQCVAWGLVRREPDPRDGRARRIVFTPTGLDWLQAFRRAVEQAEAEFRAAVGPEVAAVVLLGLEVYADGDDPAPAGARPYNVRSRDRAP